MFSWPACLLACLFFLGNLRWGNFTHYTSFLRLLSSVSLELCSSLRTWSECSCCCCCRAGVAQVSTATALRAQACFDFSSFPHFSLARTDWFSRHVPPGVYALHITHTQRGLIKVSAKPPWKVARRIIAPAIWQTQRGKSFPFRFSFRSSRFSQLACYLIFLASLFGALFAVCVAEIVFYLRLPTREGEGERERGRNDSATVAESVP